MARFSLVPWLRSHRSPATNSSASAAFRKGPGQAERPVRQRGRALHRPMLEVLEQRLAPAWLAQGPGPVLNGSNVDNVTPNNEVSGAINAIAAHPTNADILYIGAVNGGIWKTTNATAASPTWTALSDTQVSQSITALEFDPTDPTNNTLVAGIGRSSSLGGLSDDLTGLLRTTDGGTTWTPLSGAGMPLNGATVSAVMPRGSTIVVGVSFADSFTCNNIGIYRSTNTGANFTPLTFASAGMPRSTVFDIAGDPTNASTLYAGVVFGSICEPGSSNGIYKSTNTGATWTKVSNAAMDSFINAIGSTNGRIELAVGTSNNVYAAIVSSTTGQLAAVFRSGDGGASWTAMDLPTTFENTANIGIHPGGQGGTHLSIVADPTNANIVYVGGDRQPLSFGDTFSFPNSIGAISFSGRLFRGNAAQPSGSQWQHLTHSNTLGPVGGGTSNNSAPHADSREMVFDVNGRLLQADDGGLYLRTSPQDNTGSWFSLNSNLQVSEAHDIAYNAISNSILSGTQDNGTQQQPAGGGTTWSSIFGGDGGDVAVDNVSLAGSNQAIRYFSSQNLGNFRRQVIDSANNVISTASITTTVITDRQFITPIELNHVDPQRLLIGGLNNLYESFNQGGTINSLGGPGANLFTSMVYGGFSGGTPNPDLIYVGKGSQVFRRTTSGGAISPTSPLPGSAGTIADVAIDPDEWMTVFASDDNQVFMSSNGGTSWTDVTGNLLAISSTDLHTLEYVSGTSTDALIVGTHSGVFFARTSAITVWNKLSTGLPDASVWDLDYNATDNVLVAGSLGRGSWLLPNATGELFGSSAPAVVQINPASGTTLATTNVNIDVTFSVAVVGVDATDMVLSGSAAAGAAVGTPSNISGNTWRFPVSGLSNGALLVSLAPDPNDIEDASGNDLSPSPTTWNYNVNVPDRFEPNDNFAAAADLGVLGDRTENDLTIHAASNDDFYRLTAAATGNLMVTLTFLHAQGDVDLFVYNASQTQLGISATITNSEIVTISVTAGQTYYIRVIGFGGDLSPDYDMVIDGPNIPPDRFEPNDNFAAATNLGSLGDRTENNLTIHAANNDDFYRLTAVATGNLTVGVSFVHAQGNLDLFVYNASQTQIGSSTTTGNNESVTVPVIAGQTYYIRVIGVGGAVSLDYDMVIDGPNPDVTPPQVVSTVPADDSFVTSGPTEILVNFSEPMDQNPANLNPSDLTLGGPGLGSIVVSTATWVDSDTARFTFTGAWATGLVTVQLTSGFPKDLAGNALTAYTTGDFTIDTTPPTVVSTVPADGSVIGSGPPEILVNFSEPMSQAGGNLLPSHLTLGGAGLGSITVTAANWLDADTARFTFTGTWGSGLVTVQLNSGFPKDLAGNALTAYTTGDFTIDTTPPTVVSTVPADGSVVGSGPAEILVNFSEPMSQAGGNLLPSHLTLGGAGLGSITVAAANWLDADTARFTFTGTWGAGLVTVQLIAGFPRDLAGNALVPYTTGDFTIDTTPPTVVSTVPADGSFVSSGPAEILVNFSEPMDQNPANLNPSDLTLGGPGLGSIVVSAANWVDADTARFTFTGTWSAGLVTVQLTSGFPKDLAGNALVSYSTGDFTIDTTAPTVVSTVPTDGSIVTSGPAEILVNFSEPMSQAGGNLLPSHLSLGGAGLGSATVAAADWLDADTARFTISGTWGNGLVTVQLTSGLPGDLVGNALVPYATGDFTIDATAPTVVSTVPADGSVLSSGPAEILVDFSEPMDQNPANLNPSDLTLGGPGQGSIVVSAANWVDTDTARFTFTGTWGNGLVTVQMLSGFPKDLTGNALVAYTTGDFTIDMTPPTVVSTVPADGSFVNSGPTEILVNFSEPMDQNPANLNPSDLTLGGPGLGSITVSAANWMDADTARFTFTGTWGTGQVTVQLTSGFPRDVVGNALVPYTTGDFTIDTTPPQVVSTVPADGSLVNSGPSEILVNFSEPMSQAGGNLLPSHLSLGGPGLGSVTVATATWLDADTARFTFAGIWGNGLVTVQLTSGFPGDLAGNALVPYTTGDFTIDSIAPQVASTVPADGSILGSGPTEILVNFSEPMDQNPANLNPSDLTLGGPGLGSIVVSAANWLDADTARFTFTGAWSTGLVTVQLTAGFPRDPAGNALVPYTTGDFTIDMTPPTVVSTVPADDSFVSSGPTEILVNFSEPMDQNPANLNPSDLTLGGAGLGSIVVSAAAWVDADTARFTFTGTWSTGLVTVQLTAGSPRDQAGNALVPYTTGDFTIDATAPTVVSTLPADGSILTGGPAEILVNFSEPMSQAGGNLLPSHLTLGGAGLGSVTVATATWLDADSARFTISGTWGSGLVTVQLTTGFPRDLAGNALVPYTTGDFTIDVTPPTVLSTVPADGSIQSAGPAEILVNFSEPMDQGVLSILPTDLTLGGPGLGSIAVTAAAWVDADTARFSLTGTWGAGLVTVQMTSGFPTDLAGNALAPYTTGDFMIDVTPPTVVSTLPADGSTVGSGPAEIRVNFSEPMDQNPANLNPSDLTLGGPGLGSIVVSTANWVDADTARFTFTGTWGAGLVTVQMTSGFPTDLAGNALVPYTTGDFTIDTLSPFVVSTVPADGSFVNTGPTEILVDFSEAMDQNPANLLPSHLTLGDVGRGTITVATASWMDADTARFTFTGTWGAGPVTVRLLSGFPRDLVGNALIPYTTGAFTINRPPTNLTLAPTSLPEDRPFNTIVGTFSTTDPDMGDSATYTFVSGANDNALFTIVGNELRTATMFDFETRTAYSVVVQTTDLGGRFFQRLFSIGITDANEPPTALAVSNTAVPENQPAGTLVGMLSSTDPDTANTFTYALAAGPGDTDNTAFTLSGNQLRTAISFDFETKASYSIRLRTTDQGGAFLDRVVAITVTDVNEPPTVLTLAPSLVEENQPAGTLVGSFSSTDPDAGNTFTYALVNGTGSADNAFFSVTGGQLRTAAIFDFETKASYSIRVRTTDQGGQFFEQVFTITIADVNEPPTALALSSTSVAELEPPGTVVGTFTTTDPDAGNTFIYLLVAGAGSTDNGSFTISGNQLQTAVTFDLDTQALHSIRVQVIDQDDLSFEQIFTITIANVNEAPTALDLSNASLPENQPLGSVVGTFSTTDPDSGDAFTYTFVAGANDNALFSITGDQLLTAATFDFETRSAYTVVVQSTDQGGLFVQRLFNIGITDVNEAPTDLAVSNTTVPENQAPGTLVGTLSSTDPDTANTFTFALVPGAGATDNAAFTISGNQLLTAVSFDFETRTSYSIRVQVTDQGGLSFEKIVSIAVTNVNEAPAALALSPTSIRENQILGTLVGTFTTTDPDASDSFTYSLESGPGATDNASFTIAGNLLRTAAIFNFEGQTSVSIRVRTADLGGLMIEQIFTIAITDANEAPSSFTLTPTAVAENQPAGTVVGTFSTIDPDDGNTFTYSLVPGFNDADNAAFTIVGNQLRTAAPFDRESKGFQSIRVRTTDQSGSFINWFFTITVTNVNEPPTALNLSHTSISENQILGTIVGAFTSTDEDFGSTFTYSLVTGPGATDNGSFTITGSLLRTAAVFNFEGKTSYSIRVRTTGQDGLFFERVFTITITNANEAPSSFTLAPTAVAENQPIGTVVGTFSTNDPDAGNTFTYILVPGFNDTDNASFTINGNQLRTAGIFDFETKAFYNIRVRTIDQSGSFINWFFTITITNVNERPTALSLSALTVAENLPAGTVVGTFSTMDPDAGNAFTYTLDVGPGGPDNALFTIVGNQLRTTAVFDYEAKTFYSIRVRTTDQNGLFFNKLFNILIANVPDSPAASSSVPTTSVLSRTKSAPLDDAALAAIVASSNRRKSFADVDAVFADWASRA